MLMMFGPMMIGPIIALVQFSSSPIDAELFLAFPVAKPMEAHVHGFSAFWGYLAIDHSICYWVVILDQSGWFLVAHFLEYDTDVFCFACHDI